jgi:hypothetical protein
MGRRFGKNKKKLKAEKREQSNLVKRDPKTQKNDNRDTPYTVSEVWSENVYYELFYKVSIFTLLFICLIKQAQFGH